MSDEALRATIGQVKSASLADAVQKLHGHVAHVLDLASPTPGRVLFGPAATMLFAPLRKDVEKAAFDFPAQLAQALGDSGAGKVVVMACGSMPDAAVAGGVRLALLARHECAGLVTDARLRDHDEVRGYAFAAYCRGETARAGSLDAMPVATNVPVPLGGATVMPGDYVYADAGGVVIIPRASVAAVIEAAIDIEARDAERVKKALSG